MCSSCVNLKQIVVAFMVIWLMNVSELFDDRVITAFVFQLNTDFFQRIPYLNSAKDDIMQLMRKFEANRCGFRVAENRPLGTLSFN